MRSLLLALCGQPPADILATHGDYERWFARVLPPSPTIRTWSALAGGPAPDPRDHCGILISGSEASMASPEPWMEVVVELIRSAAQVGTPVLGVCLGHQLVCAAHGATVAPNPRGPEVGSFDLAITAPDPLFAGLPERITANLSHQDHVEPDTVAPGNGLWILAASELTPVQAVAAGDAVRGVQFHPEFDAAITRAYCEWDRPLLGENTDARAAGCRDTPQAIAVVDNWLRHWVAYA